MIRRPRSASRFLATALALGLGVLALPQAQAGEVDCKLRFNLEGWSVFYKTATGTGVITCDNGASRAVRITAKGGGLTFGKSKIENGVGEFSGVNSIAETLVSRTSRCRSGWWTSWTGPCARATTSTRR